MTTLSILNSLYNCIMGHNMMLFIHAVQSHCKKKWICTAEKKQNKTEHRKKNKNKYGLSVFWKWNKAAWSHQISDIVEEPELPIVPLWNKPEKCPEICTNYMNRNGETTKSIPENHYQFDNFYIQKALLISID